MIGGYEPVSYTHLIAREFSLWADSTACDAAGMDNFWRLQTLAFTSFLMNGDVFAAVPVSYTHLDVYKRQGAYHIGGTNKMVAAYNLQAADDLSVPPKHPDSDLVEVNKIQAQKTRYCRLSAPRC